MTESHSNISASPKPSLADYSKALPQYGLPHHWLSGLMHRLTRIESPAIKNALIRLVIHQYRVDMDAALQPDYRAFRSFNDFFTRALKPEARPLAADVNDIVSPVDGTVSQAGRIEPASDRLFQAKGHHFSLQQLLGGSQERATPFAGGHFATLYLSPRDYHRIHCPMDATLREMVHIPGRLFSVSPATTRVIPGLFARNERVAALFETANGPMALVMVGAIFVSSIETVWAGEVTPPPGKTIREWRYNDSEDKRIRLLRGEEAGRFNMGSTVIVLFGPGQVEWDMAISPGKSVKMGQRLARAV